MAIKYALIALFGLQAFASVITYSAMGLPRGMTYMLGYLLFLLIAYSVLLPFYSQYIRGRYVGELLAHARCPWCTYDLSGNKPDDNHKTQCPECGGLWRMP